MTNDITPSTLTQWRERLGLSRRQAAGRIGVHRDTWNSWENGKTRVPSYISAVLDAVEAQSKEEQQP